jgi:hypothetical protein
MRTNLWMALLMVGGGAAMVVAGPALPMARMSFVAAQSTIFAAEPMVRMEEAEKSRVVKAGDRAGLLARVDEEAFVEGKCVSAEWSATGKVMNVEFEGTNESRFTAVIFVRARPRFDEGFAGDVAKAIAGKRLRLSGTITLYGGRDEKRKQDPQMVLAQPSQITIYEE